MTLLEAMSLIPAVNFYDYPNKKLEEDRIKVILEKLLFQYSELLVRTVSSCFIKNTERRPDFI